MKECESHTLSLTQSCYNQTAKNMDKHSHTQVYFGSCVSQTRQIHPQTHLEWSATQAWAGANRRRCCLFQALLTRIADAPNHDKKHQKLRVSKGVAAAAAVCSRSCCVAGCLSSLTSPPKHLAREGRDSHPSCVGLRFAVSYHSGFSGNNRKAKCSEPQSEANCYYIGVCSYDYYLQCHTFWGCPCRRKHNYKN